MKLPKLTFNPRHWLFGINWDKSTVSDFTCRFLCVHFGPFLWTWNISDEIEWEVHTPFVSFDSKDCEHKLISIEKP